MRKISVCAGCHKEVKDMGCAAWATKVNERDASFFHAGCLRRRMPRATLAKARQEARDRVSWLMSDWRLVLGQWMSLRGYPYRQSCSCPVCEGFIPPGSYSSALKWYIWEVKGVTVSAYRCQVCGYFLPELPRESIEENITFERQWETLKSVYENGGA